MKIIISQQNEKISIEFCYGKLVDEYFIDRADDFLVCVDKFLKKRNNLKNSVAKTDLKFVNAGMLTERIIKAIIAGLQF